MKKILILLVTFGALNSYAATCADTAKGVVAGYLYSMYEAAGDKAKMNPKIKIFETVKVENVYHYNIQAKYSSELITLWTATMKREKGQCTLISVQEYD